MSALACWRQLTTHKSLFGNTSRLDFSVHLCSLSLVPYVVSVAGPDRKLMPSNRSRARYSARRFGS